MLTVFPRISALGLFEWFIRRVCVCGLGGRGGGGGWSVFAGAMKYFGQIMMGHKMPLKIFDGLQKTFLFCFFPTFFFDWLTSFNKL